MIHPYKLSEDRTSNNIYTGPITFTRLDTKAEAGENNKSILITFNLIRFDFDILKKLFMSVKPY